MMIFDMFRKVVDTLTEKKQVTPFAKLFKFRKRKRSTNISNLLKISALPASTKLFEV